MIFAFGYLMCWTSEIDIVKKKKIALNAKLLSAAVSAVTEIL